jgi:protoporphyrinogen oxidase
MKEKYDIVIVGSGISGMSLAYYCAKEHLDVLVIEKNNTIGGSFTTETISDFWIELGAHTMYNSYGNLIEIIEGCGIKDDIVKRKKVPYKAYKDEKVHSVISQFSIPELLLSIPSLFRIKKDNQTVESYYSKIVGKKNYRKFFQYMFNAVPSQPTNEFPANILFKKRNRRKDVLRSFTLKKGIGSIIEAISDLPGIDIMTGDPVVSTTRENGQFSIGTNKKKTFKSDFLALASSVNHTASLLTNLNPDLSELIQKIDHVHTDSVGIIIEKKHIDFKEVAGIIGINADFYSVVSRDVMEDPTYRGFVFHFRPGRLDEQAKINFICKTMGISEENLVQRYFRQNIVPSFKLGHESIVNGIDEILAEDNILLTGNYFSGMSIEDCVNRSLREYQRLRNIRK